MGRSLAATHNGIVTAARAAGFYTPKTHSGPLGAPSISFAVCQEDLLGHIDQVTRTPQGYRELVDDRVRRAALAVLQDDADGLGQGWCDKTREYREHRRYGQYPSWRPPLMARIGRRSPTCEVEPLPALRLIMGCRDHKYPGHDPDPRVRITAALI